jgi:hypothetical protein
MTELLIPDSVLAKEATDLLREHATDLLFNHSVRVYLAAAEQGRQRKLQFDAELCMSQPHSTISVCLRNSRVPTNASKSMVQTRLVNSLLRTRSLKNR